MAKCVATLRVCQAEDERYDYAFNLTDELSNLWVANFPYTTGGVVRSVDQPGYGREFVAGADFVSGDDEPQWPDGDAESVDDGSGQWTSKAMSNAGLAHRITAVDWSAPAELTLSGSSFTDQPALQEVRVSVTGGTRGRKYTVVGLVTTAGDGPKVEVRLVLKID